MTERTRYYHASPHRLRFGEALTPTTPVDYGFIDMSGIFLTTSPVPHHTIVPRVLYQGKRWHVYEVRTFGSIEKGLWDDIVAERAVVVREVGNARGILENSLKRYKHKPNEYQIGSKVRDIHK